MPRFLLLVSFMFVSLFAFTAGSVCARDISEATSKEFKQQQPTSYVGLANVIKSSQRLGSSDTKMSSKQGKSTLKSSHKATHGKKLTAKKTFDSKKTAYKKSKSSKNSFGKKKSLKKSRSYKKTASYRSGRI